MTSIENMPDRTLYLHEVRLIKEENDEVNNCEALFYKGNNINATICIFVNISDTAYILGFDNEEEEWHRLSGLDEKKGSIEEYSEESDNIIEWIENRYGEDGYGIYQMFGSSGGIQ